MNLQLSPAKRLGVTQLGTQGKSGGTKDIIAGRQNLMNIAAPLAKVLRQCGVDRATAYTALRQVTSLLTGVGSIYFIIHYLSGAEQGFYYTFGSVLGFTVFLELGLESVLVQFASHERAHLRWAPSGTLLGETKSKSRLVSLLRITLAYYTIVGVLVLAIILPGGYAFFGKQPAARHVVWSLPWITLVMVSVISSLVGPVIALLEGCGLIAQIALVRLCQTLFGSVLLWVALSQHAGLYATAAPAMASLICGVVWLAITKKSLVLDLLSHPPGSSGISWKREIWPFQWRIALSWASGYLIMQLFTPLLFAARGPVVAGQVGMSLTISGAISSLALAWVTPKAAPFGILVARREFAALDQLFFRCLWRSLAVGTLGGAAFWIAALCLHLTHHPLSYRLLSPIPLALLTFASVCNQAIFTEALYLRAHKQEPFLWISITEGLLITVSTYLLGPRFGATGAMSGYLMVHLTVGLGAGTLIFIQKRRQWHAPALPGSLQASTVPHVWVPSSPATSEQMGP